MRAAIYNRVSGDEQAKGFSLDGMERDCRAYIERNGYRLVRRYSEVGKGRDPNRPMLQKLMQHAQEGRFDVLVLWRRDRWGRHVAYNALYEEVLTRAGVTLETVNMGKRDPSEEGELFVTILDAFAQFEARKTARRCQMGRTEAAQQGIWPTKPPFGYRRVSPEDPRLEPDPEAAPIVQRAFQEVARGLSLHATSQRLGISYARVRHIVQNVAYDGTLRYIDIEVPRAWPPLVSPQTSATARRHIAATWTHFGQPKRGPRRLVHQATGGDGPRNGRQSR